MAPAGPSPALHGAHGEVRGSSRAHSVSEAHAPPCPSGPPGSQGPRGPGAQGRRCERTPLLGGERCGVALQRARVARGASDCGRLRRRTAPRRRNSHPAQFTHFQGAVSWCLVYLQGCASSPQSVLEYCLNPRKKSHAHQRPFSLSPQPPRPRRRPPPAHAPSPGARPEALRSPATRTSSPPEGPMRSARPHARRSPVLPAETPSSLFPSQPRR